MEIVSLGPLWKRVGKWLGCIVPISCEKGRKRVVNDQEKPWFTPLTLGVGLRLKV